MQSTLGILGSSDPGVDASGDLIDVVSNMMDLCTQFLNLLRWTGFYWHSIYETDKIRTFTETALFGLYGELLVLLRC